MRLGKRKAVDQTPMTEQDPPAQLEKDDVLDTREFYIIPIPTWQRYRFSKPPTFPYSKNILFGLISTFAVSQLYYIQPILVEVSQHFNVSYERVSRVPTLSQAGYAVGLLLIAPCGDLLKRRQLVLVLILLSLFFTIPLATTSSFAVFEAFRFLTGVLCVTPQIMVPWSSDLARPDRRAMAIATVLSGLMLGIMFARLVSGIITEFSSYKNVYWMATGLQGLILVLVYLFVPDYPAKTTVGYFEIMKSMIKFFFTEPLLIQANIIAMLASTNFSNFWVTSSFLLAAPPYNYNVLQTGLFGLLGAFAVIIAPWIGKAIDSLVPWFGCLIGLVALAISLAVYIAGAGLNLSAVIITCFLLDVGNQLQQVSNATRIRTIDPSAFSRLNSTFIISVFLGQVTGTQVGSTLFLKYGWRVNGAVFLGLTVLAMLVLFARGPHEDRTTWFGWQRGSSMRKKKSQLVAPTDKAAETQPDPSEEKV